MPDTGPREAVRALVIDPEDRILLVRSSRRPGLGDPGVGGVEHEEDPIEALRRELFEETGLENGEVGPPGWTREHRFRIGSVDYHQRETVYLIRTTRFDPQPLLTWEELASEAITELRWWSLAELWAHQGVSHRDVSPN